MIITDEQLTERFRAAAARIPVKSSVADLIADADDPVTTQIPVRPITSAPSWRPRHLVLAAAASAAAVVGLAVVVTHSGDTSVGGVGGPVTANPVFADHNDVYPLLTEVPAWAGDLSPVLVPAGDATGVRALVARPAMESLLEPIMVATVTTDDPVDLAGAVSFRTEVAGGRAVLFGSAAEGAAKRVVVLDGADRAVVELTGRGTIADFDIVLDGLTLHVSAGSTSFTIGDLPVGYNLVVAPTVQPLPVDSYGITAAGDDAGSSLEIGVVTEWSDLRLALATESPLTMRTVFRGNAGERLTAWYTTNDDGSLVMAWELDPGIIVTLRIARTGITPVEAVNIAGRVVLTDEVTWQAEYGAL